MMTASQVQGSPAVRGVPDGVVVVADPLARERVVQQLVRRIAAALALSPRKLTIERRNGAAPRVTRSDGGDGGAWSVSLSGTGGVWLGAAAEFPVGIDVEAIDPTFDWRAIAAEFFPETQRAAWAVLPPQDGCRAFFEAWVRWEACLKCGGLGFGGPLIPPERAARGLTVHQLDVGDGFAAAVALQPLGSRARA